MDKKRVEIRVDATTYEWLAKRTAKTRPDDWRVQDEILELLVIAKNRDRTNGLWYGK